MLTRFRSEMWAVDVNWYRATLESLLRLDASTLKAAVRKVAGSRRAGDVAVIPVHGLITQRASIWQEFFGGTSTEQLVDDVTAAAEDPAVGSIVLDVASPGGTVQGTPEAAEAIRALRGSKPITAVINPMGASAAYWLASQADEVVALPSAMAGSIGVYREHLDLSKALEQQGVAVELISYGERKTEGNPYGPLGESTRAAMQEQVDEFGQMFEAAVAKGRGIRVDTVRSKYGKGGVLTASQALAVGMVDRVVPSLEAEVKRLAGRAKAAKGGARAFDEAEIRARAALGGLT